MADSVGIPVLGLRASAAGRAGLSSIEEFLDQLANPSPKAVRAISLRLGSAARLLGLGMNSAADDQQPVAFLERFLRRLELPPLRLQAPAIISRFCGKSHERL
jgi:hypothetical protein